MPTLRWLTRDEDLKSAGKAAYRLLREEPEFGAGDKDSGNMIIQGDNLEALKSLLPFYAGQVKCIYIDPPYNTGSAFEQYDDNLEHTKWLSMMYPRLELLRELLTEDGTIWISIDDDEGHYLKVICDEVFGRKNFVANIVWQKKQSPQNDTVNISDMHDYVVVYAKTIKENRKDTKGWQRNLLPRQENSNARYENPDNDYRGPWTSSDYTCPKTAEERPNLFYPIIHPITGQEIYPSRRRVWAFDQATHTINVTENRIWWGSGSKTRPRIKKFLADVQQGIVPSTWWIREECGDNQEAKREIINLDLASVFSTPKPERLIQRILQIASDPGDIILDSFLGSGTAVAVAHKMGRRYIGIEMGEHAKTHCAVRLQKVIDGEQGGISEAIDWQGGGGFRFYTLGDTIFDENGQIRNTIKFEHLAAHIWFYETQTPLNKPKTKSAALGIHNGVAYALLYNGILHDQRIDGGNVLTSKTFEIIRKGFGKASYDKIVIYGEASRIGLAKLKELGIEFKQTPYDVRVK